MKKTIKITIIILAFIFISFISTASLDYNKITTSSTETYFGNVTGSGSTGEMCIWYNESQINYTTDFYWASEIDALFDNTTIIRSWNITWFNNSALYYNSSGLLQNWSNIIGTSTTYYPSTINLSGGTATDRQWLNDTFWYDGLYYNVTESAGATPVLDVYINYSGVTDFNQWIVREYYSGSSSHFINFEIYDYDSSTWESYYDVAGQSGFTWIVIPVFDTSDHINSGLVQTRLRHVQTGVSSHRLYIDVSWLIQGNNIGASTNLNGYAKYNFGYNNFIGSGNITADYLNASSGYIIDGTTGIAYNITQLNKTSQTPWLSDIDASGYTLYNLSRINDSKGNTSVYVENRTLNLRDNTVGLDWGAIGGSDDYFIAFAQGMINETGLYDGGSGYNIGDLVTVDAGDVNAVLEIIDTDGGGAVIEYGIINFGSGYSVAINEDTIGGSGTGFQIGISSVVDRNIINRDPMIMGDGIYNKNNQLRYDPYYGILYDAEDLPKIDINQNVLYHTSSGTAFPVYDWSLSQVHQFLANGAVNVFLRLFAGNSSQPYVDLRWDGTTLEINKPVYVTQTLTAVHLAGDGSQITNITNNMNYTNIAMTNQSNIFTGNIVVNANLTTISYINWSGGNVVYCPITETITNCIAFAKAGDTIILSSGTYTVSAITTISKSLNIVGQGRGITKIVQPSGSYSLFSSTSIDNIRISDLSIIANASSTRPLNFACTSVNVCNNITLENIDINLTTTGAASGGTIFFNDAGGEIRNLVLNVNSQTGGYDGIKIINSASAEAPTTLKVYNTDVNIKQTGTVVSSAFRATDSSATQNASIYVYNSRGISTVSGFGLQADGGTEAYAYAEYSRFSGGATSDIRTTNGGQIELYNVLLDKNYLSSYLVSIKGLGLFNNLSIVDSIGIGVNPTNPSQKLEVNGSIRLSQDNQKVLWGGSAQSSLYYNSTDMIANPKETGSGSLYVLGNLNAQNVIIQNVTTANITSKDINPINTSLYSLGSSLLRWLKGWFVNLDVSGNATIANANITGNLVIQGNASLVNISAQCITLSNNVTLCNSGDLGGGGGGGESLAQTLAIGYTTGGNDIAFDNSGDVITDGTNTSIDPYNRKIYYPDGTSTAMDFSKPSNVALGGGDNLAADQNSLDNIAIGKDAGLYNSGTILHLIALGYEAGYHGTGTGNILIGKHAGKSNTAAGNLIVIGQDAGEGLGGANTICIGQDACSDYTGDAGNCIAIGNYAGVGNNLQRSIAIGNGVAPSVSNQANIGNVLYLDDIYYGTSISSTPQTSGILSVGGVIKLPDYSAFTGSATESMLAWDTSLHGLSIYDGSNWKSGITDTYDDGSDTTITFSGGLATAISTSFDSRLMRNITYLSNLNSSKYLVPITFYWNKDGLKQYPNSTALTKLGIQTGYKAEDVAKFYPLCSVNESKNITGTKTTYLSYNRNCLALELGKETLTLKEDLTIIQAENTMTKSCLATSIDFKTYKDCILK